MLSIRRVRNNSDDQGQMLVRFSFSIGALDSILADFLNGGGNPPRPGASKEYVDGLVDEHHDEAQNAQCSICLCEFDHGCCAKLPCGHFLHSGCAKKWLHQNGTCPVCRYEVPTDDE